MTPMKPHMLVPSPLRLCPKRDAATKTVRSYGFSDERSSSRSCPSVRGSACRASASRKSDRRDCRPPSPAPLRSARRDRSWPREQPPSRELSPSASSSSSFSFGSGIHSSAARVRCVARDLGRVSLCRPRNSGRIRRWGTLSSVPFSRYRLRPMHEPPAREDVPGGPLSFVPGWPVLVLLAALLAFSFQGSRGIWEPDEGFYVNAALGMVRTGDWIVPTLNGAPFLDKPPLHYWGM